MDAAADIPMSAIMRRRVMVAVGRFGENFIMLAPVTNALWL
jgi:hypothetical protein